LVEFVAGGRAGEPVASACARVMGIGVVHTDPEHPRVRGRYDSDSVHMVWPDFPRDFVMPEVRARWLEYMGEGVDNHRETWRPQAVSFER